MLDHVRHEELYEKSRQLAGIPSKKIAPASGLRVPSDHSPFTGFYTSGGLLLVIFSGPAGQSDSSGVSVSRFNFRDYTLLVSLFLHGSHIHILLLHSSSKDTSLL